MKLFLRLGESFLEVLSLPSDVVMVVFNDPESGVVIQANLTCYTNGRIGRFLFNLHWICFKTAS